MTAKAVGKISSSCFSIKNYLAPSVAVKHVCKIWNIFLLLTRFLRVSLNEKLLLLTFSSHFLFLIQLLWDKREKNKWALTTQLKYDWSLNKFDLPLSSLFSRIRNRISSREKQIIIWFMAFRLNFTYTVWVFCFYFPSFSQMSAVIVQERKLLLYLVSFCPQRQLTHLCIFNFSASVRHFVGRY